MTGFPGAHTGRVAVVTGGASGLGRAYAERLARDGAKVVVADVADAADTVEAISNSGGAAFAVHADVSSEAAVEEIRARTEEKFGSCDILVNNAGIFPNVPWEQVDFALWRRLFSVNLDAMFLTCKAFSPAMEHRHFGRIVNISSNTFDLVISGYVPYVASKAGVIGLTRALATELGESGVTVNCVLPGLTKVGTMERRWEESAVYEESLVAKQAIKRPGLPPDLEGVISFLATDDAQWISGQTIVVDGGLARH